MPVNQNEDKFKMGYTPYENTITIYEVEHKILSPLESDASTSCLNAMGRQGWQFTGFLPDGSYVFVRPIKMMGISSYPVKVEKEENGGS